MTRITFLGLGAMGQRMARRLIDAGHDVTVWNRSPGAAASLAAAGAARSDTPHAASAGAEIVISMVTDDDASRAVWMGPDGALAGLAPGALAVECSTLSPDWIAALATAMAERGVRFVDAPVAGSRPQAEAGQLIFLAGGTADDVARLETIAPAMGRAVLHAGPTGQGATLKMIVNALLAVQAGSMAELLRYSETRGLDPQRTLELLGDVPVMSPAASVLGAQILSGQHDPMFTIDLLVKDLGYLLRDAATAPITTATRDAFEKAQAAGHGSAHISAVAAA